MRDRPRIRIKPSETVVALGEVCVSSRSRTGVDMTDRSKSMTNPLLGVEFYLYPTVITALIHSVEPELTE